MKKKQILIAHFTGAQNAREDVLAGVSRFAGGLAQCGVADVMAETAVAAGSLSAGSGFVSTSLPIIPNGAGQSNVVGVLMVEDFVAEGGFVDLKSEYSTYNFTLP